MIEVVIAILAIGQVSLLGAILYYFHKKDRTVSEYTSHVNDLLTSMPERVQQSYFIHEKDKDKIKNDLLSKTFDSYLKHIQTLEKMVLPKPITQKMVQDVLDRTPPIVTENEISKTEEENSMVIDEESMGKIPFRDVNKIIVEEGSDMPETIL